MIGHRIIRYIIIAAGLLLLISFFQLPYYVSKPGMAKELDPIVKVEDGYTSEGSFMLTTIRMGRANIYSYVTAKFSEYQKLYTLEEIKGKDESDEEYSVRQLHLMDTSKLSAIEVAYKKARLPVDFHYNGVYVLNVVPGMPADGKLKPADRIFKVDGKEFSSSKEFMEYVGGKRAGDTIRLTYEREESVRDAELTVEYFKDEKNQGRTGVGIGLVDDKEIIVSPKIEMNTADIGGPSAGFMFSLEIYNQLTKVDLTNGYKIAGTGTISSDGTVGRIGGIEQKIIAADKAGADIFLAPHENGSENSNYRAAVKTAKDIDSSMKIIPINDFDEAVDYLENLKNQKKAA